MKAAKGLTLPLAILALVAVGLAITGAVRWTLGASRGGVVAEVPLTPVEDPRCGSPTVSACGDPHPVVHLERDATIRSMGTSGVGGSISEAP